MTTLEILSKDLSDAVADEKAKREAYLLAYNQCNDDGWCYGQFWNVRYTHDIPQVGSAFKAWTDAKEVLAKRQKSYDEYVASLTKNETTEAETASNYTEAVKNFLKENGKSAMIILLAIVALVIIVVIYRKS